MYQLSAMRLISMVTSTIYVMIRITDFKILFGAWKEDLVVNFPVRTSLPHHFGHPGALHPVLLVQIHPPPQGWMPGSPAGLTKFIAIKEQKVY